MEYAGHEGAVQRHLVTYPSLLHGLGLQVQILPAPPVWYTTMYKVSKEVHKKYGHVIQITRDDIGEYESPYPAFNQAKYLRRIWMEQGQAKVRVLIDQQILTIKQAEVWADEEYKSLPKCEACGKILGGDVFTHRLCGTNLFCTQICADKDYSRQMEKLLDEEEIEYL